ncbi:hypothetical protein IGB42_02808 [Andreprevotia sp. IGB-42]|uniref:anti-sigma factor n=1 Tax=Andreprevotia sp. IGB-42 TaxID=2497473 RepID=UPI001356C4E1|nr:anti-sigma factor [Andreprevotia sp. IGB-42]KAF0812519.1 hypothetical protein IGB42_02808 [Andreprevotia sp. IGB-42]
MNYRKPELQERLAAAYALGTLRGRARQRFERLMVADAALRRTVAEWEARLAPLNEAVEPVQPPRSIWRRISAQVRAMRPAPSPWSWHGLALWRALAGGMATAALVLVAVNVQLANRPPEVQYVAVLQDKSSQVAMVVSAVDVTGKLRVLPVSSTTPSDRDLELWALPEGGKPQSLGVVGSTAKTELTATAQRIANVPALAISLEPKGGSRTGQPTGPVLYSGKLLAM